MAKIKTHQASVKRFRVTKNKKIKKRKAGQNHFNSRDSGVVTRNKRRDISMFKTDKKNIINLINNF